jgi:hypothetical protein
MPAPRLGTLFRGEGMRRAPALKSGVGTSHESLNRLAA